MIIWLEFLALTAVILYSGMKLSKYGDVIAEKTGLGRTWVGVLLLASVTSLPELISGVSAVTIYSLPDIAVGGIIGSCLFNLVILVIIDLMIPKKSCFSLAQSSHRLSAEFNIIMLAIVAFALLWGEDRMAIGWIGPESFILFFAYIFVMKHLYLQSKDEAPNEEILYEHHTRLKAYGLYLFHALTITASACYLPNLGAKIAETYHLGETFVGSIFIAFSSSLPEIVVSIAAVRIGAVDMAFGNIFGSNLFNLAILAVEDLLYTDGILLTQSSINHAMTSIAAILAVGISLAAFTINKKKKAGFISLATLMILVIYIINTYFLYVFR